jgi:hypothetical protein
VRAAAEERAAEGVTRFPAATQGAAAPGAARFGAGGRSAGGAA